MSLACYSQCYIAAAILCKCLAVTRNYFSGDAMWIFLGGVSFVAFFGYGLWRKLRWGIGWLDTNKQLRTASDQLYSMEDSTRNNVRTFRYAVPCAQGVSLRIHRESKWDRFAKKIGLSIEYQFNDPEFDDELYVVSNASAFQAELAENKALRDVVRSLFRDRRLQKIECYGQHVFALYQEKAGQASTGEVQLIVDALYALAGSLGAAKLKSASRWDAYQLRAALLAALSTALLSLGLVEFIRDYVSAPEQIMLDAKDLAVFSTACAAVVLFVMMTATVALLRGSSYAHVILAEVIISGGIGLMLGGYFITRDINLSFDQSAQQMAQADITRMRTWTSSGKYRRTYYELYLKDRDGRCRLPDKIKVSYKIYKMAQGQKTLTMGIRNGALGYRWVEGYYFP